MDTYNPDELYAAVAEELFLSRKKAKAAGGRNNIRAKGDGPEQAVRELIGSLMGGQYRVTQGHVVRADGMKSGQMDVIIVREDFLALLAQLALRSDVPVERHGGDPEFAAERGHGGVAV